MSKAGLFGALCALVLSPAAASEPQATVFDLFDQGVSSIIAVSACGIDDKAEFARFTSDFSKVADAVESELQKMNPGRTRDELSIVIGFRLAHLEVSTEKAVSASGCDAPEIKRLRKLFDMRAKLATLPNAPGLLVH